MSYDDGNNTVFIATLTNAVGYLVSSNQVIYRNAFVGIKADLVCTYRKGGFESDLVFREQPPKPEAYGLDPAASTLQMVTEFFNTQDPQAIPAGSDDWYGLQDSTLKFGKMTMGRGKAFAVSATNTPASAMAASPVYKRWLHLEGRTFLVEEVPLTYIADDLEALPLTAKTGTVKTETLYAGAKPAAKAGRRTWQFPPLRGMAADTNQLLLAANWRPDAGVVLDYDAVDSVTDFTFVDGTTYLVDDTPDLSGTITFQGGAVLKFSGAEEPLYLDASSTVICDSTPENPTIFTSMNDDTVGDVIDGSSGAPSESEMLMFLNLDAPSIVLSNMDFYYGNYTIQMNRGNIDLWNCRFLPVDIAVYATGDYIHGDDGYDYGYYGGNVGLHNVLLQEIWNDTPIEADSLMAENVTLDGYWFLGSSKNSICVTDPAENQGVPFVPSGGVVVYPGTGGSYNSAGSVFATGATNANFYLASGSPYRGVGTTNISAALLGEFQNMTTYAPQDGSWPDTNGTDLGYHYPVNEDSDHDGLPDWWQLKYFGNLDKSGTDYDSQGYLLEADYQHSQDPNIITFTLNFTNNTLGVSPAVGTINITAGTPFYEAVLVNDTNFAGADWVPFTSTNLAVPLTAGDGSYTIAVALKGLPDDATVAWVQTQLKMKSIGPVLVVTNPLPGIVIKPMIQVGGYSSANLSRLTFDVSNAAGTVADQAGIGSRNITTRTNRDSPPTPSNALMYR